MRCETCRERFTRAKGTSRRNCFNCRPVRARGKASTPAPVAAAVDLPAPARVRGEMEQAVLDELVLFDRQGSVSGVSALIMARQVDAGLNTGSQLAMLMSKVQLAVTAATAGVAPKGDALDQLEQQMVARIADTA